MFERIQNELIVRIGEGLIGCEAVSASTKIDLDNGDFIICDGRKIVYKTEVDGKLMSGHVPVQKLPKVYREYLFSCLRCWFMSANKFFDLDEIPEA